jgi:hypothetical protein
LKTIFAAKVAVEQLIKIWYHIRSDLEQNKLILSSKLELIHPTDRFSGWNRSDTFGGIARNPVTGELY